MSLLLTPIPTHICTTVCARVHAQVSCGYKVMSKTPPQVCATPWLCNIVRGFRVHTQTFCVLTKKDVLSSRWKWLVGIMFTWSK